MLLDTLELIKLRESRGLSNSELADKLELSPSTITRLENGERNASIKTLKKIASFYNISVDKLLVQPLVYFKTTNEAK